MPRKQLATINFPGTRVTRSRRARSACARRAPRHRRRRPAETPPPSAARDPPARETAARLCVKLFRGLSRRYRPGVYAPAILKPGARNFSAFSVDSRGRERKLINGTLGRFGFSPSTRDDQWGKVDSLLDPITRREALLEGRLIRNR